MRFDFEAQYQNNIDWAIRSGNTEVLNLKSQIDEWTARKGDKVALQLAVNRFKISGEYFPPFMAKDPIDAVILEIKHRISKIVSEYYVIRRPQPATISPQDTISGMECINRATVKKPLKGGKRSTWQTVDVACGHCQACQRKKRSEEQQRAMQEFKHCRTGTAWFLTITYSDEHILYDEWGNQIQNEPALHQFLV